MTGVLSDSLRRNAAARKSVMNTSIDSMRATRDMGPRFSAAKYRIWPKEAVAPATMSQPLKRVKVERTARA